MEGDAEGETEDAAGVCKAGVCDVAIDTGVEKAVMLGERVTVGEKQKQNCVNIVLAGLTERDIHPHPSVIVPWLSTRLNY